jgi:hypothetical protein
MISAKGRKTVSLPVYVGMYLMKLEFCALLGFYAALTISYRRFGPTYLFHLQRSVLKEGKQCRFLCLKLMEIEIFALLGYCAAVSIPYGRFDPTYLFNLQR